jgi:hypothetical protein
MGRECGTKTLGRFAAHALGGRVGSHEFGVLGLDALELVHQRVVGGVGDLRRVENVIQVLVAAQFGAQFHDAFFFQVLIREKREIVGFAHGENYRGWQQGSMVCRLLWNPLLTF